MAGRQRRRRKRKPAPAKQPDPPKGYRWSKKPDRHGELERIDKKQPA